MVNDINAFISYDSGEVIGEREKGNRIIELLQKHWTEEKEESPVMEII